MNNLQKNTDNAALLPCPFCDGEANYDHDENGWNWVECKNCGSSSIARASVMEDCKPLLLEQWNSRMPHNAWISVDDSLPDAFDSRYKKYQGVLAYVKDPTNLYGGTPMILFYGWFSWMAQDDQEGNEERMIKKFGWHYERESEGEYDSLIFDMNGKVTHWMPLPPAPNKEM